MPKKPTNVELHKEVERVHRDKQNLLTKIYGLEKELKYQMDELKKAQDIAATSQAKWHDADMFARKAIAALRILLEAVAPSQNG